MSKAWQIFETTQSTPVTVDSNLHGSEASSSDVVTPKPKGKAAPITSPPKAKAKAVALNSQDAQSNGDEFDGMKPPETQSGGKRTRDKGQGDKARPNKQILRLQPWLGASR